MELPPPTRKRAPGGGRKRIDGSGALLVPLNVSVTPEQRQKFREHLGAVWLRRQIDQAEVPAAEPGVRP